MGLSLGFASLLCEVVIGATDRGERGVPRKGIGSSGREVVCGFGFAVVDIGQGGHVVEHIKDDETLR